MKNRFVFQALLATFLAIGLVFSPLQSILVVQSARLHDGTPAPVEDVADGGGNDSAPVVDAPVEDAPAADAPASEAPAVEAPALVDASNLVVPEAALPSEVESSVETESTPEPVEEQPAVAQAPVNEKNDVQPILQVDVPSELAQSSENIPAIQPAENTPVDQQMEAQTPPVVSNESKAAIEENQPGEEAQYISGKILVQFDPSTSLDVFTNQLINLGYTINESGTIPGIMMVDVPSGTEVESADAIQKLGGIHYAEPVYLATALDLIPNDPGFPSQPNMLTIDAPGGWNYFTGSSKVIVAIIDTGMDINNPDFAGRLVQGYDFVNGDDVAMDDNGHGTHVAGTVSATGNNGIGVAGLDWAAKIMPIKVLNSAGKGTELNVYLGILYAVDHGAQIINLSLGMNGYSTLVASAVDYAYQHGVTVVAASGNTGSGVNFPASMPHVISVGAVDDNENQLSFSNFGNEMDLVAPGKDVLSTTTTGLMYKTGTSMAAAHVSGLASLLRGMAPLSPDQVKTTMENTSKDLGTTGWDVYFGNGLIQVRSAIMRIFAILEAVTVEDPDEEITNPTPYPTYMPTPLPTPTLASM